MQKITIRNTETGEETEATPEQLGRLIDELQMQLQNQFNFVTDLRQEFAELKKQNEWQPIDTAPKDGAIILVLYKNELKKNRIVRASWFDTDDIEQWEDPDQSEPGWYERSEVYEELEDGMVSPVMGEPTHWMPLPKTPEAK